MISTPTTVVPWIPVMIGGPLLGVAVVVVQRIRLNRTVRRAVEEQGFLVRRMEPRFMTRGPFDASIGLPGISHSDSLYRVLAEDRVGSATVLWARIPVRMPWNPSRCELCRDIAPDRTPRGIGASAFYTLVVGLAAAMIGLIVWISARRVFSG